MSLHRRAATLVPFWLHPMSIDRRAARLALLLLLATAFTPGCGAPEAAAKLSATVPVSGKVTYKGKPLTHGAIAFEPDAGREAHGEIGPDGAFTLTTFARGDGAVEGVHRVSISGVNKKELPLKFHSPSSSEVEVVVGAGQSDYPIDLK